MITYECERLCDFCNLHGASYVEAEISEPRITPQEAHQEVLDAPGWIILDGQDMCPKCADKRGY